MALRVEEIVKPRPVRSVWAAVGVIVVCGVLVSTGKGPAMLLALALFCFTMFGFLVIHAWVGRMAQDSAVHQARQRFHKFIGHDGVLWDVGPASADKGVTASGLAFDPASKTTYVLDRGRAAEIPWSAIRRWRWVIEGYGTVMAITMNPGVSQGVAAHNMDSRAAAARASGFFIECADVDYPEWQFQCTDRAKLTRWHEIFTQANEGRLTA